MACCFNLFNPIPTHPNNVIMQGCLAVTAALMTAELVWQHLAALGYGSSTLLWFVYSDSIEM